MKHVLRPFELPYQPFEHTEADEAGSQIEEFERYQSRMYRSLSEFTLSPYMRQGRSVATAQENLDHNYHKTIQCILGLDSLTTHEKATCVTYLTENEIRNRHQVLRACYMLPHLPVEDTSVEFLTLDNINSIIHNSDIDDDTSKSLDIISNLAKNLRSMDVEWAKLHGRSQTLGGYAIGLATESIYAIRSKMKDPSLIGADMARLAMRGELHVDRSMREQPG